jgi:hypothetical protein
MTQERRRSIRLGLRLPTTLHDQSSSTQQQALTQDVSGHGMCLLTNETLSPGTRLAAEVKLPDLKAPLAFDTEVVWSRPVAGPAPRATNPSVETGVRFVRIDPKDRALIMLYARLHTLPPRSVAP